MSHVSHVSHVSHELVNQAQSWDLTTNKYFPPPSLDDGWFLKDYADGAEPPRFANYTSDFQTQWYVNNKDTISESIGTDACLQEKEYYKSLKEIRNPCTTSKYTWDEGEWSELPFTAPNL